MNCLYCQSQLPDSGYYCPICAKQSICKSCNGILIKDAIICIECGEEVQGKIVNPHNTIEFIESRSTRTFKASFTDTVGGSISEAFGVILANKIQGPRGKIINQLLAIEPKNEIDIRHEEIINLIPNGNLELEAVNKIIRIENEKTTQIETRLKAKSKMDYAKRLAIIFLYHKNLLGEESVPRKELNAIMNSASVEDGNFRYWLSNNPQIGVNGDTVQIKTPGIEFAKKYIQEIFNPDIKDKWQIGTQSRGRKSKEKKKSEKGK